MLFVTWIHLDLIISKKAVHEGYPLKIAHIINHNICDGERKLIFETSGVQIAKVYTNPDLYVLLGDRNNIGDPIMMLLLPDETRVYELLDFYSIASIIFGWNH